MKTSILGVSVVLIFLIFGHNQGFCLSLKDNKASTPTLAKVKDNLVRGLSIEDFRSLLLYDYNLAQFRVQRSRDEPGLYPLEYFDNYGNYFQFMGIDVYDQPIYYTTANSGAFGGVGAFNPGTLQSIEGLEGQGITVGVWDGALPFKEHLEFSDNPSRITYKDPMDKFSSIEQYHVYQLAQNHATHIVGTLTSFGINPESKSATPRLHVDAYVWANHLVTMFDAAKQGLILSSHSYTSSVLNYTGNLAVRPYLIGAYLDDASKVDNMAYLYRNYLPVVVAGNNRESYGVINPSRKGFDILYGINLAKNVLTIGNYDPQASKDNYVFRTSSYGPSKDYRIKPDLMAPGHGILSTMAPFGYSDIKDAPINLYSEFTGTSMSVPIVVSVLAMWQQWGAINNDEHFLSATLRALAVHSANGTPNQLNTQKNYLGPNAMGGWGVIDARKGIDFLKKNNENAGTVLIEKTIKQGETYAYYLTNNASTISNLKVTLSWTDPAGNVNSSELSTGVYARSLVNDLDIRVVLESEISPKYITDRVEAVYQPWYLNKDMSNPIALRGDNDVDNLEQIDVSSINQKSFKVVIYHKGKLFDNQQDFSLLLSADQDIYLDSTKEQGLVDKIIENIDFKVVPNPTSGIVEIVVEKGITLPKDVMVSVYNFLGMRVFYGKLPSTNQMDFSLYPKGIYLLRMNNKEKMQSVKVVRR